MSTNAELVSIHALSAELLASAACCSSLARRLSGESPACCETEDAAPDPVCANSTGVGSARRRITSQKISGFPIHTSAELEESKPYNNRLGDGNGKERFARECRLFQRISPCACRSCWAANK